MEFSSKNTRGDCHFFSPEDLPDWGIEPESLLSPALADGFFTTALPGKPVFHLHGPSFLPSEMPWLVPDLGRFSLPRIALKCDTMSPFHHFRFQFRVTSVSVQLLSQISITVEPPCQNGTILISPSIIIIIIIFCRLFLISNFVFLYYFVICILSLECKPH